MGRRRARRRGVQAGRRRGRRRGVRRRSRRRRRRRRVILAGGMIALGSAAIYKLSTKDVDRIEEKTGKPAEELSDEELQAVIEDLQIQIDELSDADMAAIDDADAAAQAQAAASPPATATPATAPPAAAPAQADYVEELKKLAELKDAGIVTEEEFEAKKKQLLGL